MSKLPRQHVIFQHLSNHHAIRARSFGTPVTEDIVRGSKMMHMQVLISIDGGELRAWRSDVSAPVGPFLGMLPMLAARSW